MPDPPSSTIEVPFEAGPLHAFRRLVSVHARCAGLRPSQSDDLILAVNEVATNSLRHGGGSGILRLWHEDDAVKCEIRDQGHIPEPMIGRLRPRNDTHNGRGLWLANQLCDLVQIRSSAGATVVRLHMRRGRTAP